MSITRGTFLVASLFTILFLAGYTMTGAIASPPQALATAIAPMLSSESSADATVVHQDSGVCSQEGADSSTAELSLLTGRRAATVSNDVGSEVSVVVCGGAKCHGNEVCTVCNLQLVCLNRKAGCT